MGVLETNNIQSLCVAAVHVALLQVYDILNSLEDRLGVNSSAVVLAAMKVCTQLRGWDQQLRSQTSPGLHGLFCGMTSMACRLLLPNVSVYKPP
jgi:hypothetical protein